MEKENICIDLDQTIVDFVKDKTGEKKIDISEYVYKVVYLVLEEQKIKAEKIYVSIGALNESEIQKINKKYRGIDRPTDVLSFPIFEKEELDNLKEKKDNALKEIELGDIFLCLGIVEAQAKEYQTGIVREVIYMITHGICHLVGFDHIEPEDKLKMRALEEKILSQIGVER